MTIQTVVLPAGDTDISMVMATALYAREHGKSLHVRIDNGALQVAVGGGYFSAPMFGDPGPKFTPDLDVPDNVVSLDDYR